MAKKKRNQPETIDEAIEVLSEVARQDQYQVKEIVDDKARRVTDLLDAPARVKERVKESFRNKSTELTHEAAEIAGETADKFRTNPWPFLLGFIGTIGVVGYSFYRRNQFYRREYRPAH